MVIYQNKVKAKGDLVQEFGSEMVIFFGDNAPDILKDYCYSIDILKCTDKIKKDDYFVIDNDEFKILAVGDVAQKNLENLGHLTINFNTNLDDLLPGSIIVENIDKKNINIDINTIIKIIKK